MMNNSLIAIQKLKDGSPLFTIRKKTVLSEIARTKAVNMTGSDRYAATTVSFKGITPFDELAKEISSIVSKMKENTTFTRYNQELLAVEEGDFHDELSSIMRILPNNTDDKGSSNIVSRVNDMFAKAIPEDMWEELTSTGEL